MRIIKPIEVNTEMDSLPDGVYGYSYAHLISSFSSREKEEVPKLKIQSTKHNPQRFFFEIKKYNNRDVRIVGYISDEAEITFNKKAGLPEDSIIIFPYEQREFKNKIEIPIIPRNLTFKEREVESPEAGCTISILEARSRTKNMIDQARVSTQISTKISPKSSSYSVPEHITRLFVEHSVKLVSGLVILLIIFILSKLTGANFRSFLDLISQFIM